VKFDPRLLNLEGTALGALLNVSIVKGSSIQLLIGPLLWLIVAEQPLKVTLPKFASGRTSLLVEGASTIHSAELLSAVEDSV
jgi:hypothetical protein